MQAKGIAGLHDEDRSGRPRRIDRANGDRGDVGAAAEEVRRHALVEPAAGPAPEDLRRARGEGLARVRRPALAGQELPVLHRPAAGRPRSSTSSGCTSTRRRTRSCSGSTRSPRSRRWTGPRRCCRCSRGLPERRSHDYVRHGTTTLFAALEIATGKVTAACKPRHRHQEFLAFLKQVDRAYPDDRTRAGELHLVMDNYAAHKHPERQGLAGRRTRGSTSTSPRPTPPG